LARIVDPSHRDATTKTDEDTNDDAPVALDGDQLVIRRLTVRGAPADAVRHCIEHGGDAEEVTRQMLDIGGVVLQHGANSTLVQAVIAEMRSEGVTQVSLRGMAERVAAKGLRYEEQVQPMLEAAFASHGDIVEATGGTPGLDGKNKKGDFVATLNPDSIGGRDRRVVIEAKDRGLPARMASSPIWLRRCATAPPTPVSLSARRLPATGCACTAGTASW